MRQPLVSIIIPTRDRSALVVEALESIRAQSYPHWEALVCDDRSEDSTRDTVLGLARDDARIRYVPARGAPGAPARRNEGIDAATGDYVIFLDSDDQLAPHCLGRRVEVMQAHPELDFGVFPCRVFKRKPGDTRLLWNADTDESDIDRYLRKDLPWQTTGPIWRRSALDRVGPWDELARAGQDWEYHLRALIKGLRYARFDGYDCYWRAPQPGRDSIGNNAPRPDFLRHRVEMIARVHCMLTESGRMSARRRELVAGQFFFVASTLAAKGARAEGQAAWSRAWQIGVVDTRRHAEGWLYLQFWHRERVRRRVRAWIARAWPGELFLGLSPTHMNTPLPLSGSTDADRAVAAAPIGQVQGEPA